MEPLNSAPPARVRSKTTYSIEIELDTSSFPAYTTGVLASSPDLLFLGPQNGECIQVTLP